METGEKMKRKLLFVVIFLAFVLTACSSRRSSTTPTVTPTQASSPSQEVTDTPSPTQALSGLAGAYPVRLREDIYSVSLPEIQSDYIFDSGEIRDDYVLLKIRSDSEPSASRLVLFPIYHPELAKTFEIKESYNYYKLADKGTVVEALPEKSTLNIYSSSFELTTSVNIGMRSLICCDGSGRCWYMSNMGFLGYYDTASQETKVFDSCSYKNCESFLHEEDGSIWFLVTGFAPFQIPVRVDLKSGDIYEAPLYPLTPAMVGPTAIYNSQNYWYYAHIDSLSDLYSFRKSDSNESIYASNEQTAISALRANSLIDDVFTYSEKFTAFRLNNGGTFSSLTTDLFDNRTHLSLLSLSSNDMVLFTSEKDGKTKLYIWDLGDSAPEPDPTFHKINTQKFEQEAASKIAKLKEKYGVNIYYDQDSLSGIADTYEMFATDNYILLMNGLDELEDCMSEYPENFFREVLGHTMDSLEIYLTDGFRAVYSNEVQNPSAYVTGRDTAIIFCIDLNSAQNNFNSSFAHEIMHIMEYRITEYSQDNNKDISVYWYQELNSPDYPYFFGATDENGNQNTDPTATAMGGDPDAWFIDTYARTNPFEDTARVIEHMYLQNSHLFTSEHLKVKGQFLIAVLREVFPSIKASKEPILWEKMLGIDGPSINDYDIPPM